MGAMMECSSDSCASVDATMEVTSSVARCDLSSRLRSFLMRFESIRESKGGVIRVARHGRRRAETRPTLLRSESTAAAHSTWASPFGRSRRVGEKATAAGTRARRCVREATEQI